MILSIALCTLTSATPHLAEPNRALRTHHPRIAPGSCPVVEEDEEGVAPIWGTYEIGSLGNSPSQPRPTVFLPSVRHSDEDESEYGEESQQLQRYFINMIEGACEEELNAGATLRFTPTGRLLLHGPPALHEKVAGLVSFFQQLCSASAELRVDFLALSGEVRLPSVMPAHAVQGLIDQAVGHHSETMQVRSGQTAISRSGKRRNLIMDFDVEIAQGTVIMDPVIADFFEGVEIQIQAAPAQDGLHLALCTKRGDSQGPVAVKQLDMHALLGDETGVKREKAYARADQQVVGNRSVALSAKLPTDKALVISMNSEGAGVSEVMIVRQTGGQLPVWNEHRFAGGGLAFSNPGSLSPPGVDARGTSLLTGGLFNGSYLNSDPKMILEFTHSEKEAYTDLLYNLGERSSGSPLPWLVFNFNEIGVGHPSATGEHPARNVIEALQASPDQFELELRILSDGNPTATAMRIPISEGQSAALVMGSESTAVRDYDVEVAGWSATPDPVVSPTFSGLAFVVEANSVDGDHIQIDLLGCINLVQMGESTPARTPFFDQVDAVAESHITVNESRTITREGDQWQTVLGNPEGAVALQVNLNRL